MTPLIHHGWHWTLVLMMTAGTLLAILLAITGVASLIAGQVAASIACVAVALGVGLSVVWIGRHRDDLLKA